MQKRPIAQFLIDDYRVSVRRATSVVLLARGTFEYKPKPKNDEALRAWIREIVLTRVRYGFWRIYILLSREGWKVNHKRVYRLYKLEGLNLRSKRPRRSRAAAHRLERVQAAAMHERWSMDFVADQLFNGRQNRALTVVDNFSRKCLAIHVDSSIKGSDVTDIVNRISERYGQTQDRIQVDNGSEFISKALDHYWIIGPMRTL